jgi:erythromycin esterase
MRFLCILLVTILVALVGATVRGDASDPTPSKQARRELSERAVVIPTLRLDANVDQLSSIGAAIGNARIVGMGEGSHGTSEFFAFKNRLFKYLIERKGFTVLAVEASWGAGRMVDRYVKGGPGTAGEAVADLRFWTLNSPEMLDLIRWMRAYNMRLGKHDLLSFAGFDMQDPTGPANYLAFALPDADINRSSIQTGLACVFTLDPSKPRNDAATNACRDRVVAFEPDVSNIADSNTRNIAQSALSNLLEYIHSTSVRDTDDVRDPAMAQNIIFMSAHQFTNQKIALWAHNIHLDRSRIVGATTQPMGHYLRKQFGSRYYSIGQTFGNGTVRAVTRRNERQAVRVPSRSGDSIAALFSGLRPATFLDLRSLPQSGHLGLYFRGDSRFEEMGAVVDPTDLSRWWIPMELPKMYDGIVYIPTSTASVDGVAMSTFRRSIQIADQTWTVTGPSLEDVLIAKTGTGITMRNGTVTDSAPFGLYRIFDATRLAGRTVRLTGEIRRLDGLGYTAGVVESKAANRKTLDVGSSLLPLTSRYGTWVHFSETIHVSAKARYIQGGAATAGKGAVEMRNLSIEKSS